MSQIPTENEDNRFVAASDFVQLDQPDEMSTDQQEQQQFGLHQSTSDCTMNTGNTTRNYDNDLKEQKLMIANLEVFRAGTGEQSVIVLFTCAKKGFLTREASELKLYTIRILSTRLAQIR
jgi:hypothetical protein